jgi:hypothetical protein
MKQFGTDKSVLAAVSMPNNVRMGMMNELFKSKIVSTTFNYDIFL